VERGQGICDDHLTAASDSQREPHSSGTHDH
jgi:hypothetical protein